MKGGKAGKIRLLILAKDLNKYQKAAQFLTRRGWPTDAVSSIKQAVEFVVKYRPTFVLVSMSHPNPNVVKLPNLLMQTFNASCIAFGESSDTKTLQRLNTCKLRHVFHGAMSGPSIHMRIKKILLDEEREQERARQAAMTPPTDEAAVNDSECQTVSGTPSPSTSASSEEGGLDYPSTVSGRSSSDSEVAESFADSSGRSPYEEEGGEGYWAKKKTYGNDSEAECSDYGNQGQKFGGESDYESHYDSQQSPLSEKGGSPEGENPSLYATQGSAQGYSNEYPSDQPDDYPQAKSSFDQVDSHDYSRTAEVDSHGYPAASVDNQSSQVDREDRSGIAYMPSHDRSANNEVDPYSPSNIEEAEMGASPVFSSDLEGASPETPVAGNHAGAGEFTHQESEYGSSVGFASAEMSSFGDSPFRQARRDHEEQLKQAGYMPQNTATGEASYASPLEQNLAGANHAPVLSANENGGQNYTAQVEAVGAAELGYEQNSGHSNQYDSEFGLGETLDKTFEQNDSPTAPPFQRSSAALENGNKKNEEDDGPIIRKGGKKPLEFEFDPADPFVNPGDMFFDPKKLGIELSLGSHYTIPPSLIAEPNFLLDNTGHLPDIEEKEEEIECDVAFRNGLQPDKHLKTIAAIVDSGFKNACRPDTGDPMKIRKPSTVGIITARYDNKMGYILVALPQDCEDTDGFLLKVKSSIESQKHVKNVEIRLHAEFYSHIDPVEFVDWANNFAEFVSTFHHRDMEVAMAFVATTELPDIRKADDKEGMYVVAVDNIVPDIPVNYVGYINLKKNDKMIQYIKNGRSISTLQKERLKDKQVETIYISEKDTDNFKAHYASALLNQLIKQYNDSLSSQQQAKSA